MKVTDYIARCIVTYPLLCKCRNMELSRIAVLRSAFAYGNCYWTKDGYLWDKERVNEYKPYGKVTYDRAFDDAYFQQHQMHTAAHEVMQYDKKDGFVMLTTSRIVYCEDPKPLELYPNAPLLHIPKNVQADWLAAALEYVDFALPIAQAAGDQTQINLLTKVRNQYA